ncbi:hypothetical protein AB6A40_001287 [Gnathostoma spinigerum]|uniref:Peptidase A1 domain-containing protein n=1 Tax=Gnathostoma spinigerum TaxID=75299 RepID=A0ABD6ECM9_9BILA
MWICYFQIGLTDYCGLAIAPFSSASFGAMWVMGAPFFREYCQVYDYGARKIGFAKVKHRNNSVDTGAHHTANAHTTECPNVSTRNDSLENEIPPIENAQTASHPKNCTR